MAGVQDSEPLAGMEDDSSRLELLRETSFGNGEALEPPYDQNLQAERATGSSSVDVEAGRESGTLRAPTQEHEEDLPEAFGTLTDGGPSFARRPC